MEDVIKRLTREITDMFVQNFSVVRLKYFGLFSNFVAIFVEGLGLTTSSTGKTALLALLNVLCLSFQRALSEASNLQLRAFLLQHLRGAYLHQPQTVRVLLIYTSQTTFLFFAGQPHIPACFQTRAVNIVFRTNCAVRSFDR
jgi:hypothetical protein